MLAKNEHQFPKGESYLHIGAENDKRKIIKKRKRCIRLVVSAIFMFGTVAALFGFTLKLASDIKFLRGEVELMKISVKKLESRPNEYNSISQDRSAYDTYRYTPRKMNAEKEEHNFDTNNDITASNNSQKLFTGSELTNVVDLVKPSRSRSRRNVTRYMDHGVPVKSEYLAEAQPKNETLKMSRDSYPSATSHPERSSQYQYQEQIGSTARIYHRVATSTPSLTHIRKSRIMHRNDKSKAFSEVVQKSSLLKSGDQHRNSMEDSETELTIERNIDRLRHRPPRLEMLDERHPRVGRMRPLPTAHFNGDTSKYVLGQHENFNGNGHLRHPQRTFVDWIEPSWYHDLSMDKHFSYNDGFLVIKETGIYFVYAQVYYLDEHDTNGFRVYKNEEPLLQCTTTSHSIERNLKGNTCYTAAAQYLEEGDRVSLGDLSPSRYSLFETGKSFFGVIKLGDIKIK